MYRRIPSVSLTNTKRFPYFFFADRKLQHSAEQATLAAEAQRKKEVREVQVLEQSRRECERFHIAQAQMVEEARRWHELQKKTRTTQDEEATQQQQQQQSVPW